MVMGKYKYNSDDYYANHTPGPTEYTFYGHAEVGAEMADNLLKRLGCLSKTEREDVVYLVENHMKMHVLPQMARKKQAKFLRHPASARLLALFACDSLGSRPIRLEEITKTSVAFLNFKQHDRLLADLEITGKELIKLGQTPGPVMGKKLETMQALLDKNPRLTRTELLTAVGIKES